MSIIDKIGRHPDEVIELDNGDITYVYGKTHYRYGADGVYVTNTNEQGEHTCVIQPDDSIEVFEWANSWSWLAVEGDEPMFELGLHFTEIIADRTPSGRPATNDHMSLWIDVPYVSVQFHMNDEGLIVMEDLFCGDVWLSQSVSGAIERFEWLISKQAEILQLEEIQKGRAWHDQFWSDLTDKNDENEEEK